MDDSQLLGQGALPAKYPLPPSEAMQEIAANATKHSPGRAAMVDRALNCYQEAVNLGQQYEAERATASTELHDDTLAKQREYEQNEALIATSILERDAAIQKRTERESSFDQGMSEGGYVVTERSPEAVQAAIFKQIQFDPAKIQKLEEEITALQVQLTAPDPEFEEVLDMQVPESELPPLPEPPQRETTQVPGNSHGAENTTTSHSTGHVSSQPIAPNTESDRTRNETAPVSQDSGMAPEHDGIPLFKDTMEIVLWFPAVLIITLTAGTLLGLISASDLRHPHMSLSMLLACALGILIVSSLGVLAHITGQEFGRCKAKGTRLGTLEKALLAILAVCSLAEIDFEAIAQQVFVHTVLSLNEIDGTGMPKIPTVIFWLTGTLFSVSYTTYKFYRGQQNGERIGQQEAAKQAEKNAKEGKEQTAQAFDREKQAITDLRFQEAVEHREVRRSAILEARRIAWEERRTQFLNRVAQTRERQQALLNLKIADLERLRGLQSKASKELIDNPCLREAIKLLAEIQQCKATETRCHETITRLQERQTELLKRTELRPVRIERFKELRDKIGEAMRDAYALINFESEYPSPNEPAP